jgi:hypothetical protein
VRLKQKVKRRVFTSNNAAIDFMLVGRDIFLVDDGYDLISVKKIVLLYFL